MESLLLSCRALSSPTTCRFIPALSVPLPCYHGDTDMSYQWLHMRITEESERRQKEANMLEKMPQAVEEVRGAMAGCVDAYTRTFGPETAELQVSGQRMRLIV